jgi:hypothetical protein
MSSNPKLERDAVGTRCSYVPATNLLCASVERNRVQHMILESSTDQLHAKQPRLHARLSIPLMLSAASPDLAVLDEIRCSTKITVVVQWEVMQWCVCSVARWACGSRSGGGVISNIHRCC